MKELAKQLNARIARIDDAIILYYEKNNKKEIKDPETGVVWQKRQGTTQVYDDKKLKELLKTKGILLGTIYRRRLVEERDDQALYKLLQEEKLTLEDIEAVSHLQNHKPYLMALEPKRAASKKKSAPDTE